MLSGNIVFNVVVPCANILSFSHLLSRRNLAPNIKNLLGQLQFTSKLNVCVWLNNNSNGF